MGLLASLATLVFTSGRYTKAREAAEQELAGRVKNLEHDTHRPPCEIVHQLLVTTARLEQKLDTNFEWIKQALREQEHRQ